MLFSKLGLFCCFKDERPLGFKFTSYNASNHACSYLWESFVNAATTIVHKISSNSTAPKINNGILKTGSECSTTVVGKPAK